jgi:hypothetical protein
LKPRAKKASGTLLDLREALRHTEDVLARIERGEADEVEVKQLASLMRERRTLLERIGSMTGEVQGKTVAALFTRLGVSSEAELRDLVGEKRALSGITVEDLVRDCLAGLKLAFGVRPELLPLVREELFGPVKAERLEAGAPQMEA